MNSCGKYTCFSVYSERKFANNLFLLYFLVAFLLLKKNFLVFPMGQKRFCGEKNKKFLRKSL